MQNVKRNRNLFFVSMDAGVAGDTHPRSYVVKASSLHVALARAAERFERDTDAATRSAALRSGQISAYASLLSDDEAETYRNSMANTENRHGRSVAYRVS